MTIFQRWWDDPVASSSIAIAIVAGIFAVYQLRSIPVERRRRILDAMVTQYAESASNRGQFLRSCPILLKMAYDELGRKIDEEMSRTEHLVHESNLEIAAVADLKLRHLDKLRKEAILWAGQHIGISFTSAAEVLASEFKTRGGCNAIPGAVQVQAKRLHWELWALPEFGISPAPGLRCDWLPRAIADKATLIPHNPVYALKLRKVGSCLAHV